MSKYERPIGFGRLFPRSSQSFSTKVLVWCQIIAAASVMAQEPSPQEAADPNSSFSSATRSRSIHLTGSPAVDQTLADIALLEALKDIYNLTREEVRNADYKSYFASDRFTEDYKAGKWNGALEFLVNGQTYGLEAGASDESLRKLQDSVKSSEQFVLSSRTKDQTATRILSPEVLAEYRRLVHERNTAVGLKVEVRGERTQAYFDVRFVKVSETMPWPKIRRIFIDGGTLGDKESRIGKELNAPLIIRAIRTGRQDVMLTLETDVDSFVMRAPYPEPLKRQRDVPVGTVVASVLALDAFLKASGEDSPFDAAKNTWAPADGRAVSSSEYIDLTGKSILPDLRGKFLRGVNVFDPSYPIVVKDGEGDPTGLRLPGSYQPDQLASHVHQITAAMKWGSANRERAGGPGWGADDGNAGSSTLNTGPSGAEETRSKNIAVMFYIKIR